MKTKLRLDAMLRRALQSQTLTSFAPQRVAAYDRNGALIGYVVGAIAHDRVPSRRIPNVLRQATVAVEDKRFYGHHGIDYYRLVGALVHDVHGRRIEGGSTITMQLVKDIIEPTVKPTFFRKLEEIYLANRLEGNYTKNEILNAYLNDVFYGSNADGAQAASRTYFDKPVWKIDLAQAALLAGLPQAPTAYDPFAHPRAARSRRDLVLALMVAQGYLTRTQARLAQERGLELRSRIRRPSSKPHRDLYPQSADPDLLEYIRTRLNDQFGETRVQRGGLAVYTTIDPLLEAAGDRTLVRALRGRSSLGAAVVMLDPRSGRVLVLSSHSARTGTLLPGHEAIRDTALKLAAAYAPRAAEGMRAAPILITLIHGEGVDTRAASARLRRAMAEDVAVRATRALRMRARVEPAAGIGVPVAVTGPHREPYGSWFVGYTPDYVTAVVVSGPKRARKRVTSLVAGRVWHDFMFHATSHGCYRTFPRSTDPAPVQPALASQHLRLPPQRTRQVLPCRPSSLRAVLRRWTSTHPETSALIVRSDGGAPRTVLAWKPSVPRMPGSTMKVLTAAGALIALGPDFRFRTSVFLGRSASIDTGVFRGPLYLKGYGDPVLSTSVYARRFLLGSDGNFGRLARFVRASGISLVRGPIIADESFFDGRRVGPYWKPSYRLEVGPLSALGVNEEFKGDAHRFFVTDPPLAAAKRFEVALAANGVRHDGPLRAGRTPPQSQRLGSVSSPPLHLIVRQMVVPSDIFIAETLAKDVGAYAVGYGSTSAGVSQIAAYLRERHILGLRDGLVDGSGLSRADHVTPASMVRLLVAAERDRSWGQSLLASLPRSHQGTLWRRFISEPAVGLVQAKTGHLRDVSALVGIVRSKAGKRYVFALMMNHYRHEEKGGADAVQNQLVELLASGAADSLPSAARPREYVSAPGPAPIKRAAAGQRANALGMPRLASKTPLQSGLLAFLSLGAFLLGLSVLPRRLVRHPRAALLVERRTEIAAAGAAALVAFLVAYFVG
ncbi:MAG: D-alanyl-D-alanine carboxypeptidase/D-alanyl-D-alanine-endopeptidase [Gaiellaceae bacterium]